MRVILITPVRLVALLALGAVPAPLVVAGPAAAARPRVDVVAGFYPLAWAAEQVGGRRVHVVNLTPAGTEPHDLELTTDQRDHIEDADVVLVLGGDFQPAVEDAASARDTDFIPAARKAEIVAYTSIVGPGERDEVTFTVPKVAGKYSYLCSFAGHFAAGMTGIMLVK